jgi:hypothetical protein
VIKQINSLRVYPIDAPVGQMPILRISDNEYDRAADVVMSNVPSQTDLNELTRIIQSNFYRSVYIRKEIETSRSEIEAAIRKAGATTIWCERLPTSPATLFQGGKVRRGTMAEAVRSICMALVQYRTLWRSMGQVAILECPTGSDPWLRPLEISEVEMMVDALGVEADDTQGESGYVMNRVVYAAAACLPSWLPPAASVERTKPREPAGYDRATETIRLP